MDTDSLLEQVIAEARQLSIPVSNRISPQVVINRRAKTRLGCCKRTPQGFIIELSERMLPAGEPACREILAHEILHTCPGCQNHQSLWKRYAAMMGEAFGYQISRTRRAEEIGAEGGRTIRYRLKCERCGAVIERMRKSNLIKHYRRYRCRCGGKLKPV